MTGWCGQQEAFTYVSVDLGTLHRVKAILVKVGLIPTILAVLGSGIRCLFDPGVFWLKKFLYLFEDKKNYNDIYG